MRANAELTNQLSRQKRTRSRRDQASYSYTESSVSLDYHHRSTRPRLDESYAQATEHQHALSLGQLRVGPSTSHSTGPSSRGGAIPYHVIDNRITTTATESGTDARNRIDPIQRQRTFEPYIREDLEPRRRDLDRRPRPAQLRIVEPDHTLTQRAQNVQMSDTSTMIRQMIRESQGLTNDN